MPHSFGIHLSPLPRPNFPPVTTLILSTHKAVQRVVTTQLFTIRAAPGFHYKGLLSMAKFKTSFLWETGENKTEN